MKINLKNEKVGYFSVRKRQTKSQAKSQFRIKTSADQQLVPNEEEINNSPHFKQSNKLHPLQIPSQRYFKRVLNKDISPNKFSKLPSTSRTSTQRKEFVKISLQNPNQKSDLNTIQQKQNESSTYNFSLGLFNKSKALNSSFFASGQAGSGGRKSTERKLDFNKIYIQTQEQSFRSVIQLSVRELQNRQMLDKAVQELDKRKFQKKIKILKKNMGLNSPKSKRKVDQAIELLRNQSIGYKTFYRNQISTARDQRENKDETNPNSSRDQFKTPRKVLNTLGDENNQQTELLAAPNAQKIFQQSDTKNNIIIEDEDQYKKSQEGESHESSLENQPMDIEDEFRKTDEKFKDKMDSKQVIEHNPSTEDLKLPSLIKVETPQKTQRDPSLEANSQNLKLSSKPRLKTSSVSMKHLSAIIKPQQTQSLSITRNQPHTKLLQSLKGSFQNDELQQNPVLKNLQSPSDEFPFLMTKEDLQTTLNKSRYQMKKLLCMHVQRRQQEWKEIRRKMLLEEDNLNVIEEKESKGKKQKQKISALPPQHLLKIQTKQLKKSVRSFVCLLKSERSLASKLHLASPPKAA